MRENIFSHFFYYKKECYYELSKENRKNYKRRIELDKLEKIFK